MNKLNEYPQPVNMYVLVEIEIPEEKTVGGIIVSPTKKDEVKGIGIVRNVSQNCINSISQPVKIGQSVAFNPYESLPLKYEGHNFFFVKHEEIIAIMPQE